MKFRDVVINCFILAGCFPASAEQLEWSYSLSSLGDLESRYVVRSEEISYLMLSVNEWDGDGYRKVGLSSPVVTAGPMALSGLFREVFHPLSFGPGSDVYQERGALNLDLSFSRPVRTGISLTLGNIGMFLMDSESVRKLGFQACFPDGGQGQTELLLSTSLTDSDYPQDGWYSPQTGRAGGRILQTAVRHTAAIGEGELCLTGCGSGGSRMAPGFFSGAHCRRRFDLLETCWNLGFASRLYRNPDGRRAPLRAAVGYSGVLRPTEKLSVKALYRRRIRQPADWLKESLYPGGRIALEGDESFRLESRSEVEGESGQLGVLKAAVLWKGEHSRTGQVEEEIGFLLEGSLRLSSYTVSGRLIMTVNPYFEGALAYSVGQLNTSITVRRGLAAAMEPELKWEGSLGSTTFRVFCQAARLEENWEASFGWVMRIGSRSS